MTVLLSAPHAGCFSLTGERDCDLLAEKAARYLNLLIPESKLYVGYVKRKELDLNRDQAFNDPFRVNLRRAADQFNPVISLDIHSFPTPEFNGTDLTILDESPGTDYGHDLHAFLQSRLPYRIGYYKGAGNSIMNEMRSKGIPSILIEFNEDLSDDDLTSIDLVIIEWLIEQGYLF